MAITLNEFCAAILKINKNHTGPSAKQFLMQELEDDFVDVSLSTSGEAGTVGGEYLGEDNDWVNLFSPSTSMPNPPMKSPSTFGASIVVDSRVKTSLAKLGAEIDAIVASVTRDVQGESAAFEKQQIKCLLGILWALFSRADVQDNISYQASLWWADIFNFIERQLIKPRVVTGDAANRLKTMAGARPAHTVTLSLESRLQNVLNLLTEITPDDDERTDIEFPDDFVTMPNPNINFRFSALNQQDLAQNFNDISLLLSTEGPNAVPLLSLSYSATDAGVGHLKNHRLLKEIYDQIMVLISLDFKDGTQHEKSCYIYKIMAILLEYDNNPCLYAFQLILEYMRKRNIFVYEKKKSQNEVGMYFISMKKDSVTNHYKLLLSYNVDLVGVYILDHGVVGVDSIADREPDTIPPLTCRISCWINLNTFEIEPVECSIKSNIPILIKLISEPTHVFIELGELKAEVEKKLKGKNTFERNNIYPLCIPLSTNLWLEYFELKITPKILIELIKNNELESQLTKQASCDYLRQLTVEGQTLPNSRCEKDGGYSVDSVRAHLEKTFGAKWQSWHQFCLNMLVAQTWFNPIECILYRFMAIISEYGRLSLSVAQLLPNNSKHYDLTYNRIGQFCLEGVCSIYKIHDLDTDEFLVADGEPFIRFHMKFYFPNNEDGSFSFNCPPTITINPECEQYTKKLIQALQQAACKTNQEMAQYGSTKLVEMLWREYKENLNSKNKRLVR